MQSTPGIHHVTAVTGDLRRNRSFYVDLLGLRLVKRTVNFDAPESYHLYYAPGRGRPGTTLTFFVWPEAAPATPGPGRATRVSFGVAEGSLGYWTERLRRSGVDPEGPRQRFGEPGVAFEDPDGLRLEIVASRYGESRKAAEGGAVPPRHSIRGFHAVTLTVGDGPATRRVLERVLGMEAEDRGEPGGRGAEEVRFRTGRRGIGSRVDLVTAPDRAAGRGLRGGVHHVAWRAYDVRLLREWRERLRAAGLEPTPVVDRHYYRSVYFREPGGILCEMATDSPGFTVDEPPDRTGSGLRLPPWLEDRRTEIESSLPAWPGPEDG